MRNRDPREIRLAPLAAGRVTREAREMAEEMLVISTVLRTRASEAVDPDVKQMFRDRADLVRDVADDIMAGRMTDLTEARHLLREMEGML